MAVLDAVNGPFHGGASTPVFEATALKAQLLKYWDRIQSGFWFLPSLMAIAAIMLAFGAVWLDRAVAEGFLPMPRILYAGSPQGATAVLSTIAGSMITIAGVVFSITLVALSLASSQFGPRLLRNFMRDNTNQVVLGTFVATFLYCVLVLRAIQHGGDSAFVPHLALNLAVLLALASIGVLIYFIHHISLSIQADEIIARVATDLQRGIDRLFPEQIGRDTVKGGAGDVPTSFEDAGIVTAPADGYLQIVDSQSLVELARSADVVIRLDVRPGDYLVAGCPVARVLPALSVDDTLRKDIRSTLVVGNQRSTAQDVEFCVQQLVEVAVRALSPGINDPFTAMGCIDRLGAAYCRVAERDMPSAERLDVDHRVRVIAPVVTFQRMVDPALSAIRQSARANVSVTLRLLDTLATVATCIRRETDARILRRHADLVKEVALDELTTDYDRQAIEKRHARAIEVL